MKLIKAKTNYGSKIWINPNTITYMSKQTEYGVVFFADGGFYKFELEEYKRILKRSRSKNG